MFNPAKLARALRTLRRKHHLSLNQPAAATGRAARRAKIENRNEANPRSGQGSLVLPLLNSGGARQPSRALCERLACLPADLILLK